MRFCVFFTVLLLRPALSLSNGTTSTTPVSSPENTTTTTVTPAATTTTKPSSGGTSTTPVSSPTTTATTPTEASTTGTPTAATTTTKPSSGGTSTTPVSSPTTTATTPTEASTTGTPTAATTTTKPSSGGTSTTPVSSPTTTATTPTEGTTDSTNVTPTANSTTNATDENTTTTTVTPAATTTTKPSSVDPCNPNPCGKNAAKCISMYTTYDCQCPYGFYYDSSTCQPGKIFPGTITLRGIYPKDIETVNSSLYLQMFQNLTDFFEEAFNSTDYKQTVIVEVHVITGNTRSENFEVNLTVMNIFVENTKETNETVSEKITKANQSGYLKSYGSTTHCAVFKCDNATTECQESEHPQCMCKSGFSKTEWDDLSCSDCSSDCSADDNKYCAREDGVPKCHCMNNFKWEDKKCVSCPVGYSGQNCENNSELILIIVGTVFGAIILCLVVAVSIVSVRAKCSQDPEKKSLIKPKYSNPDTSSETRIFPRVQTTSGHTNPGYQPNPYEARSSNRNRFLDGDYDDVYDISREPEGFRMQRR